MSQESLTVTSRTYLSTLERGLQSPTLDKLDEIAGDIGVHPLTLLFYAYTADQTSDGKRAIAKQLRAELKALKNYDAANN